MTPAAPSPREEEPTIQPGDWAIYPMDGFFHVTRHRKAHEKDQEYRGSFRTEEKAREQIALLERDERVKALLDRLENPSPDPPDAVSIGPLFEMGAGAAYRGVTDALRKALYPDETCAECGEFPKHWRHSDRAKGGRYHAHVPRKPGEVFGT